MEPSHRALRRHVTFQEISERAGVTKSTVSRALKDDPRVSPATKERILSIAEALGYAPNAIAHSLATQRSNIIGFIGSETQNYWYQENIQTLAKHITLAGRQMMLFQVMKDGTIDDVVPQMIQYRLSGCIVIPAVALSPDAFAKLERFGVSAVLLNRSPVGSACAVRQDQEKGAYAVAQLFAMAAHERIAFIAGNSNPAAVDRERGFLAGLRAMGHELYAREVGMFTFRDAYAAATRLLAMRPRPDAIFAGNDMMALATIEACRAQGVSVPDELSVVGYDNGRAGAWPSFALTTVEQPFETMFRHAIDLILARDVEPTLLPEVVEVDAQMILRRSARLPHSLDGLVIGHRQGKLVVD